MDPIVPVAAKAAVQLISEAENNDAKGFLSTILHTPAVAIGHMFADFVNERRHANLIRIAKRAQQRLHDAGVSPKEVSLSIIHPALEAASLEEDPDLQEVWANLLANAADARKADSVPPSFPAILKVLSAKDVKFLDALFRAALDKTAQLMNPRAYGVGFEYGEVYDIYGRIGLAVAVDSDDWKENSRKREFNRDGMQMCLDTYSRQQLFVETGDMDEDKQMIKGEAAGFTYNLPYAEYKMVYSYGFTVLGDAFVTACRPPAASS